ncbi:lactonase family protein [Dyadobacter sp. NIV53]|uniref:lactonase family protein n=1 Tax=Dyadobacter sp. NIV53 TaxID=2861765 RepID=UPI001C873A73|nr:lactonase family protein [Dyadobacter sp. NIV53]
MKKLSISVIILVCTVFFSLQNKTIPFYIGSQDKGLNSSISLCELDLSTGKITLVDTFNNCTAPGYVSISPDKKNLYAISSDNKINAFAIGADKKLNYLNSQPSEGSGPCHVSVDPSGKMVFASNYGDGSFAAYTLQAGGKLNSATYKEQFTGSGPNTKRQEKAHAHFAGTSPDGKYVYVVDLGSDKIMNYTLDAKSGKLTPNPAQPFFSAKPGSGPRHFIFHPNGRSLFLLNELEATLTSCSVDKKGVITSLETYSTLPADFAGNNTSAAIHLHPNGKFVYVSNRGHNSISAFKILDGGKLEKVDEITKSVSVPRDFNIDPTGKYMIVANQDKDNLVVYTIDPQTGKLTFLHESISVKAPICVAFL